MRLFTIRIGHPYIHESGEEEKARKEARKLMEQELVESIKGISKDATQVDTWNGNAYIVSESAMVDIIQQIGTNADDSPSGMYIKSIKLLMEVGDPMEAIRAATDKMEAAAARFIDQASVYDFNGKEEISGGGWNEKTQSPVSGHHLININELTLCENFCTDALQEMLSDCWRIVAVCPQEARRPDYVLGRHNPKFNGTSAGRG